MSGPEHDLRVALRRLSDSPPEVTNLVERVETRARQRRNRGVAVTAAVAILAVLGVGLALWLPDRDGDAIPATKSSQQLADAKMQYAAFVAWWDGRMFGLGAGEDTGVIGTVVSTGVPPFECASARMADGQPAGTQSAWVLGRRKVLSGEAGADYGPLLTYVYVLGGTGVTTCDGPAPGETLVQARPRTNEIAFAQPFSDPSSPALDVAAIYESIPSDEITSHGREVFADYQDTLAKLDFGTSLNQTDRALRSLAGWIGVGSSRHELNQDSPQTGPVVFEHGHGWLDAGPP